MRFFRGVDCVQVIVIKIRSCIAWYAREHLSDVRCNFLERANHTVISEEDSNVPLALHLLCKSMKEILATFSLKNLLLSWSGWQQHCLFCHAMRSRCDLPIRYVH